MGVQCSKFEPFLFYYQNNVLDGIRITQINSFYWGGAEIFRKNARKPLNVCIVGTEFEQTFRHFGFEPLTQVSTERFNIHC